MTDLEAEHFTNYICGLYPNTSEDDDLVYAINMARKLVPEVDDNVYYGAIGPHTFYSDEVDTLWFPNKCVIYKGENKKESLIGQGPKVVHMPLLKSQPKVDEEEKKVGLGEANLNLIEGQRIETEILKMVAKPTGFDHVEVKHLGNHRHRVSFVTKIYNKDCLFPTVSRPLSWYVVADGSDIIFSPTIGEN